MLPLDQLKKLDFLRKNIDPDIEARSFLSDMSITHNLFLDILTGKYFEGEKILFEKIVKDPKSYTAHFEKDRITSLINNIGIIAATKILSSMFEISPNIVHPKGWKLDERYLKIKKDLWFKYHKQ